MKTLITTLSILTIGGFAAGSAIAGPGDAHPSFASQPAQQKTVQIALFRSSSGERTKVETKRLPSANPKIPTARTVQVTGHMSPRN